MKIELFKDSMKSFFFFHFNEFFLFIHLSIYLFVYSFLIKTTVWGNQDKFASKQDYQKYKKKKKKKPEKRRKEYTFHLYQVKSDFFFSLNEIIWMMELKTRSDIKKKFSIHLSIW